MNVPKVVNNDFGDSLCQLLGVPHKTRECIVVYTKVVHVIYVLLETCGSDEIKCYHLGKGNPVMDNAYQGY